jgi:hypothetical protein
MESWTWPAPLPARQPFPRLAKNHSHGDQLRWRGSRWWVWEITGALIIRIRVVSALGYLTQRNVLIVTSQRSTHRTIEEVLIGLLYVLIRVNWCPSRSGRRLYVFVSRLCHVPMFTRQMFLASTLSLSIQVITTYKNNKITNIYV